MSNSDLTNTLRLAFLALLNVAKGASERNAIQRAILSDPRLAEVRHDALNLILSILREQDLLDRIIYQAHLNTRLGTRTLSLFRLAVYEAKVSVRREHLRELERAMRNVSPAELLRDIEYLIGETRALDISALLSGGSEVDRVALQTHNPPWWVEYCFRLFDRDSALEILAAPPRPRYIRVNTLRNRGRKTLPASARGLTGKLAKIPSLPGAFSLSNSPSPFFRFFSQGVFQMQDLASFLAVVAAEPRPGEMVLDLCAAPGGKTVALAQSMRNRGRIVSVDYSSSRMRAWKREVDRLGVKIAESIIGDGTRLGLHARFDLVVIDPPCTGTGILDRNPSMKWHLSSQSLTRYSTLQRNLLESAAEYVAKEGRILYCTCSLTVEENEDLVDTFLKSHSDFESRPVLRNYGSPGLRGMSDCRRLYPHRDRTAGYFISLLQRVGNE